MIITFCGHSNCLFNEDIKEQLKNILITLKFGNSWLINMDELYAFFKGGGERK